MVWGVAAGIGVAAILNASATLYSILSAWFYHEMSIEVMKAILQKHGIERIWDLSEGGDLDLIIAVSLFQPSYAGVKNIYLQKHSTGSITVRMNLRCQ